MNEKDFVESCTVRAADALKPYIPLAIESAVSSFGIGTEGTLGKTYSVADIPKVIQLAGMFYRQAEQNRKEYQSDPEILLSINPETIITSEELIKEIMPVIRRVRTALFSREDPPFPNDVDRATAWLENQVRVDAFDVQKEMPKELVPIKELTEQLTNQAKLLAKAMPDGECRVAIRRLTIHYQTKDGTIKKLPVFKGKPSEVLFLSTKGLSEETNFSQVDLLTFLLTGIKPMLPCMRIRRGIAKYPSVQVDFYRGLSYKEAASLIRNVNRTLKPTKKDLTSRHFELYQFVAGNGGVPTTGKMEYWERMRRKWNRQNPTRQFGSSKCIQIAYTRVLKSLRIKR